MFEGWESCLRTERGEWQLKLPSKCSAWAVSSRWSQTPHVPVSTTAGRLLGFTQNVLYSGNTEHISARAGCLHPVVSCYKSAAKPIQLCCTHSTALPKLCCTSSSFPWAAEISFSVCCQTPIFYFKKKLPTEFFCALIIVYWVQMGTTSVGKFAEIFFQHSGQFFIHG